MVENGISSMDPSRNRTVFKGYFAGSPPALLGRVDARYLIFNLLCLCLIIKVLFVGLLC